MNTIVIQLGLLLYNVTLPVDSSISPLGLLDAQVHVGLRQLVLPVSIRLQGSMFNGRLIQIDLLLQFSHLFLLREETHGLCFMHSFNVSHYCKCGQTLLDWLTCRALLMSPLIARADWACWSFSCNWLISWTEPAEKKIRLDKDVTDTRETTLQSIC